MDGMTKRHGRLARQVEFLLEVDKVKSVYRRTWLIDKSRLENDAEHSWHIALLAVLLSEYADEQIDLLRVVKMLLIHDLVEIDAGDTYVYDEAAMQDQEERERKAADRIFGMLPDDQAAELRRLWDEFEARRTPEARYALAMDTLQPFLHNYFTKGTAWEEHGVTAEMVHARTDLIEGGSPALWRHVQDMIRDAIRQGFLPQ